MRAFFSPKNLFISTNKISDIEKITFFSILFVGFFLFAANTVFDTDGGLFILYANALVNGPQHLNPGVARYDIAYPLLLLISGYAYHHSLIGITLIHATMSIIMPVLIYLTVRPASSKIAFYTALASILSFSTIFYMKWVRPDHAYTFFSVLSICLLVQFIDKKKAIFLYGMTFALVAASLSRSAGNLLYPIFIVLTFLLVRGSLKKYIISILIVTCMFFLYAHHRHQFFSQFGTLSSFNGGQTFQNLYVNSQEYGIQLSPETGPALKKITDNLFHAMQPSPIVYFRNEHNPHEVEFLNLYVFPYTTVEFAKQVYKTPCRDYYDMLYGISGDDPLFFKASLEVIKKYPLYPLKYISRNMWHLLYSPGYAHTKFNIDPFSQTGIQETFPFDNDSNELPELAQRAQDEVEFDNFSNKPHLLKAPIRFIRHIYFLLYIRLTKITFFFIALSWIAAIVDLCSRILPCEKLKRAANIMIPRKIVTYIIIAVSIYLLQSMLIISVFVDPMFRFNNHLIPFKLMLIGIGISILANIINQTNHTPHSALPEKIAVDRLTQKKYKIAAAILFTMVLVLFAGWTWYIILNTM